VKLWLITMAYTSDCFEVRFYEASDALGVHTCVCFIETACVEFFSDLGMM